MKNIHEGCLTETLKYAGRVKISFLKGKKPYCERVFHNSGTSSLFELLCKALAGNFIPSSTPKYLGIFTTTGGVTHEITLTRNHYSSVITAYSNSTWKTTFTFIVPGGFLEDNKEIDILRLYNNGTDTANMLAEVDLSAESPGTTDSTSNLMIQWEMSFTNV